MYITEKEIRNQFDALQKTIDYMTKKREEILTAFDETRSLCVIGCGSSFCLAQSAAKQFTQLSQIPAFAIAAGDLLVNTEDYEYPVSTSTLLLLSRSGSTSEVLKAAELCREKYHNRIVSVCAKADSPVETIADTNLVLPWCFDESVCQTRTVSNLYIAGLMIAAIVAGNSKFIETVQPLCEPSKAFCRRVEEELRKIGQTDWNKAVVLADSAVGGLAEESALAFKEICRRDSNYYHLLDVRHGPMVQIDPKTLVIVWSSSGNFHLQADAITDLSKKTSHVLVLSRCPQIETLSNVDTIILPDCGSDETSAVYALYCVQQICLQHALKTGINPDAPEGLDAWIQLN